MEIPERKEITKGYFVGDTVILMEETEETKRLGFEKGVVGIVSKNDTKETLKGWKVVDYEKNFKEAVDKMNPEEVGELFAKLVEIGKIKNPIDKSVEITKEKEDEKASD